MERVGDRQGKMEGHCSTGQSPQRAVALMEEEEEVYFFLIYRLKHRDFLIMSFLSLLILVTTFHTLSGEHTSNHKLSTEFQV